MAAALPGVDALVHAAGVLRVGPLGQLDQPHLLKSCQRLHAGCAPAGAGHPQAQGHIVLRRGTQHVRALKQHGLALVGRFAQRASFGALQAVQGAQQRALAAAVGAHQRHALAAVQRQADAFEGAHGAEAGALRGRL